MRCSFIDLNTRSLSIYIYIIIYIYLFYILYIQHACMNMFIAECDR